MLNIGFMKLTKGNSVKIIDDTEIETRVKNGFFNIIITSESDISLDGGHTFEDTINEFSLNNGQAKDLIVELSDYLNDINKGE